LCPACTPQHREYRMERERLHITRSAERRSGTRLDPTAASHVRAVCRRKRAWC
jgi:hypothetical protein